MLTADHRPTAIFTASDTQALGVIAAARELGLHVPDDLSVIGYDDIEAADYVGLTTVRQQLFESGRRGAEVLLAEIGIPIRGAARSFTWHRSWWSANHGASEGGPWMTTPDGLGEPTRNTDGGGVFMISNAIERAGTALSGGRLAALAVAGIVVAACAAPGPSRRRRLQRPPAPTAAAPSASSERAPSTVSERGGRGSVVRNRPRRAERLLRDRLRSAVQALGGVHEAVPERDLEDQPGPVHEPHDRDAATAVRRQSRPT